jgi:hydrogenase maturation protease
MNFNRVEEIAAAVLYEGYMLYPYRASAIKNQQRWNFGVLCPRSWSELQEGSDAWKMQTECLLQADASTLIGVEVRFLQIVNRTVGKPAEPLEKCDLWTKSQWNVVDKLTVGSRSLIPWQEAQERKVTVPSLKAAAFSFHWHSQFDFKPQREIEPVYDTDGMIAGVVIREWEALAGSIDIHLRGCREGLVKVSVVIRNTTEVKPESLQTRAEALLHSLVSVHTILGADDGAFVSLLDPPREFEDAAAKCSNLGTWPVLVGEDGAKDAMLSSPIILYDYPQIAPESPGALFDGTEIDEILSLRILTMTDEEKEEMRLSDDRARRVLERTENMPPEQFIKLHGAMRGVHPAVKEAR